MFSHELLLSLAYRNDNASIEVLLEPHQADLDVKLITLALFLASSLGHAGTAGVLITGEMNSGLRDSKGMSSLHLAALNNPLEVVSILLNKSFDLNVKNTFSGHTLWTLIRGFSDHETVAQLLINAGAKLDINLFNRENPLYVASAGGYIEHVRTILNRGMNPSSGTTRNWLPFAILGLLENPLPALLFQTMMRKWTKFI